jgi:hypothetical protein
MKPLCVIDDLPIEVRLHRLLDGPDVRHDRLDVRLLQRDVRAPPHASRQQHVTILDGPDHAGMSSGRPLSESMSLLLPVSMSMFVVVIMIVVVPREGVMPCLIAHLSSGDRPIVDDVHFVVTRPPKMLADGLPIIRHGCDFHGCFFPLFVDWPAVLHCRHLTTKMYTKQLMW